ncbi:MAG TPA: hypothetical protein PLP14_11635, partial [Chitinophagaceae bacterium]|nr:hypothetical protein [Chitinophagaceae bacterium]
MNLAKGHQSSQIFSKSWFSLTYNPMFFTRRFLYRGIEQWAPRLQGHVLDLGCGTKPYRPLFTHAERYTGVDIEISGNTDQKESVDVFY